MSRQTLAMTTPLYQYLLSHSLRESAVLQQLRRETGTLAAARMQISPEQGQFMAMLVRLIGARKTLDIGTFTGYSALVVAQALPADGKVITCDVSDKFLPMAQQFWGQGGVAHKIEPRLGKAIDTLNSLIKGGEAGTIDFAFIDADKAGYKNYFEACLQLLRKGGLIAVDNTLWSGKVADPAINDKPTREIRAFNDFVHKDERVAISLVPIGDGLTLLRKL